MRLRPPPSSSSSAENPALPDDNFDEPSQNVAVLDLQGLNDKFEEEYVQVQFKPDELVKKESHVEEGNASSKESAKQFEFEKVINCLLSVVTENHEKDEEELVLEDEISYEDDSESDIKTYDDFNVDDSSKKADATVGDEPIYRGHSMTIGTSLLLILLYAMKHEISGSQLSDLLTLIGLHCLEVHPGLKSLSHFKRFFAGLKSPLIRHFYCANCLKCVHEEEEICTNTFCGKTLRDKSKRYI